MKKMPSIFMRDFSEGGNRNLVTREQNPECAWVFAGEGTATRKYDGTACMVRAGKLFKRYNCKKGKTPPPNFEACQEPDLVTGHHPGWVPVGDGPEDKWFRVAWLALPMNLQDSTYELCGPKVNEADGFKELVFIRHGATTFEDTPRTFAELALWFEWNLIEGIVWHHPDGRMAKIKRTDFGWPWPLRNLLDGRWRWCMDAMVECLTKARALVQKGWCQGHYAVDCQGMSVCTPAGSADESVVSVCSVGALMYARSVLRADLAVGQMARVLLRSPDTVADPVGALIRWNDELGRKKEEVVALYDEAIQRLEKK